MKERVCRYINTTSKEEYLCYGMTEFNVFSCVWGVRLSKVSELFTDSEQIEDDFDAKKVTDCIWERLGEISSGWEVQGRLQN